MKIEYKITKHPAAEISSLVYFCTEKGECNVDQVASDQLKKLEEILNREGNDGWELVQLSFGEDGVVIFWKKAA
jgi:hypothetical protein